MILYPGKGMVRRSRIAAGLIQLVKIVAGGLRMRVDSFEYDEARTHEEYDDTQEATVEGIPRP